MKWFLAWRIKRLQQKIERLAILESNAPLSRSFPFYMAKYKAELKLKDLQAEYDMFYAGKYTLMVKRGDDA